MKEKKHRLPTIKLNSFRISRLICGGNPVSGFSHHSREMDWEMMRYYTAENIFSLLRECEKEGINTVCWRGDRHLIRILLEYYDKGGKIQWIAQTASEWKDIFANISMIKRLHPVAIYHHGTHVDNMWHAGRIDEVRDIVRFIKDNGILAGIASHIPEVIEYAEEHNWGVDFYLACFYNLARQFKPYQATLTKEIEEHFEDKDREAMVKVIKGVNKPCFAFKILSAGRKCASRKDLTEAFRFAFDNIKPTDGVVVGMFQKHRNQVQENARIIREILGNGG